jgi:two-component system, cell cycle sensor histidine kinase and response regulator CckA
MAVSLDPEVQGAISGRIQQELARRSITGALVYFVVCLVVALVTPYPVEHPSALFSVSCLMLVLGSVRFLAARRVILHTGGGLSRDILVFRMATYASFLVWGLFCGLTVHWYAGAWTAMLLLLCTASLAGGASTSLAPDLAMARRCMCFLMLPTVVATLLLGEARYMALSGLAAMYLVFLMAQTHRAWLVLWEAAVAAEREKVLGSAERRRAEGERASLAAAVEQSAAEIVITDVKGNITYCNPSFEYLTGYTREEVVGRNPKFLKSGQQDGQFYRDMWNTIMGGGTWAGQFTNRKKDGTLYQAEGTISPIHDAAGTLTGFVAATRDVTGRLRMEEQLRQAQKMEGIGRLAGGVAHDFNNLLTVIQGYSGLLEEKLRDQETLLEYAQLISKASGHAAGLTKQLLAFSRKQIIKPRPMDLNEAVSGMLPMLERLVGEDVEVVTQLADDLGLVRADADQTSQILINLTANARDAMPKGGTLCIRTTNLEALDIPGEVEIPAGPVVLLEVSDTGVGMSQATRENIFEPFFTTKERGRGTGLGLATVYGIVKQNGGLIQVVSRPGEGATFSIYLPRIDEQATIADALPREKGERGSETILVVEDHDGVRGLIVGALELSGFQILQASGGAEALLLAAQHPGNIHLLLTDVIMPGMTGKDVSAQLLSQRPGTKVLFISGYSGELIAHRGILDAGVDYLAKPFTPESLVTKVREVLGGLPKGQGA